MKLSAEWAPAKMVEALSANANRMVGDAGLKVSASTLVLVLGITDEARANFLGQGIPVKPEHKYLFYREHPDCYNSTRNGEPCPMLWGVRFGFFDCWARRGCPAWWGVYDDAHPLNAQSELLPEGADLSEVCALSQ